MSRSGGLRIFYANAVAHRQLSGEYPEGATGSANMGATPATVRRQVRTLTGLRTSGILRASGGRVRRVVRRTNPESRPVASEISRGTPPYQYSRRKDPDVLSIESTYVSKFTSVSGQFICVLPIFTERHCCATGRLLAAIKATPPNRNSPPEDRAGCRAHSASLARRYML
jgi:hypothetical protein